MSQMKRERRGMKETETNLEKGKWRGNCVGGVGQQSSQHLFSQGFVWASLNMDGVWSRAEASGTPQTAQLSQAHSAKWSPAVFVPRLSVFYHSSFDSVHSPLLLSPSCLSLPPPVYSCVSLLLIFSLPPPVCLLAPLWSPSLPLFLSHFFLLSSPVPFSPSLRWWQGRLMHIWKTRALPSSWVSVPFRWKSCLLGGTIIDSIIYTNIPAPAPLCIVSIIQ